jgi:hypothetical protein
MFLILRLIQSTPASAEEKFYWNYFVVQQLLWQQLKLQVTLFCFNLFYMFVSIVDIALHIVPHHSFLSQVGVPMAWISLLV